MASLPSRQGHAEWASELETRHFKHLIHKFRSGSSECWPTIARQVPVLRQPIAHRVCRLYRGSKQAMVYSTRLVAERERGIDFSSDHILDLECTIPELVQSGVRNLLKVPPNFLPPIRMSEIARSNNIYSFHRGEAGNFFQVHVLACGPAVRTVNLKVRKNTHRESQRLPEPISCS